MRMAWHGATIEMGRQQSEVERSRDRDRCCISYRRLLLAVCCALFLLLLQLLFSQIGWTGRAGNFHHISIFCEMASQNEF